MKIDLANFNTIIFDFGGVILDINPDLSIDALRNIGGEEGLKKIESSDMLWQFERGEMTRETLYKKLCTLLEVKFTYDEFIQSWNAMLLEFKVERINKIKELSLSHKLIMLSNTNEIHFEFFSAKLFREFGVTFYDLFNNVYLSHEMGLIKPDKRIYKAVINEQKLIPEKTLFIEDTVPNALAAEELGIKTLVIPRNGTFYEFFE